jgi:hypothetical protein
MIALALALIVGFLYINFAGTSKTKPTINESSKESAFYEPEPLSQSQITEIIGAGFHHLDEPRESKSFVGNAEFS